MSPDGAALAAIVILIFLMGYFFLAAPAFLLVKLDIQQVTQLLRGMFNAHFLMTSIAGAIGTVVFAVTGRPVFAIGVALIAAFAVWGSGWFLQQWDTQLSARDAGDDATRDEIGEERVGLPRAVAANGDLVGLLTPFARRVDRG